MGRLIGRLCVTFTNRPHTHPHIVPKRRATVGSSLPPIEKTPESAIGTSRAIVGAGGGGADFPAGGAVGQGICPRGRRRSGGGRLWRSGRRKGRSASPSFTEVPPRRRSYFRRRNTIGGRQRRRMGQTQRHLSIHGAKVRPERESAASSARAVGVLAIVVGVGVAACPPPPRKPRPPPRESEGGRESEVIAHPANRAHFSFKPPPS
jgi:hypothetical protein